MVSIPLHYPIHYDCQSSEGKFAEYVFVESNCISDLYLHEGKSAEPQTEMPDPTHCSRLYPTKP